MSYVKLLDEKVTLESAQFADLKHDLGHIRIWLTRELVPQIEIEIKVRNWLTVTNKQLRIDILEDLYASEIDTRQN